MKGIPKAALVAALVGAAVSIAGCGGQPTAPSPTSLEIQAFQKKEFETTKDIAFGSVLSVFQDLGYIIDSANKDTGFITAASAATGKTDWILTGNRYNTQTKATAFAEELRPGIVSVRLNFVVANTTSRLYGQTYQNDKPIHDPQVYQSAFEKIEDAIFIRSGAESR